jgi:phage terminase large subunit
MQSSTASATSYSLSDARSWIEDPVAFATVVLRVCLWSRQAEFARAVRDHGRVAVRSGHKTGKSTALAVLALWFVCTHPRARVIFTAASYRQVKAILYKEMRRLYRAARWPLGGEMHANPEGGLQFKDGREIIGFSTDDPERFAGFSGPNMLFIVDEASGVEEKIFEAIEGNRAGGAKIAMSSNPTKTTGTFYDAFHSSASWWHGIHLSSEEVAAEIAAGRVPRDTGLATPEWVEEKRQEWGEDDPRYQVRVRGNFPKTGDKAMISRQMVEDSTKRWTPQPPAHGTTTLGVDVARYGTDSTAIVWARGDWASRPIMLRQLDTIQVAERVVQTAREVRLNVGDKPIVRIDASNMGAGVADWLKRYASNELEVVEILAAESSQSPEYSRMRDHCWGSLQQWLKDGGAIPDDPVLVNDVVTPEYGFDPRQRIKVEAKHDMRRRIGRSTDAADALALAVFATPTRDDLSLLSTSGMPQTSW